MSGAASGERCKARSHSHTSMLTHPRSPEQVTQFGQTVLWVGFAGMSVGVLALFATTFRAQYRYRLLHVAA